jgi:hypothetical protein
VKEVVTASREGGPSLNVLAGLTAGNFSAYWMGLIIVSLMGIGYGVSTLGLSELGMQAPAVFAFGLIAFGFLGMGPVTIAVDSYGPVTDNAQSVYELSIIEGIPDIKNQLKKDYGFDVDFEHAKHMLEANDGAGNTFKATAKPVLIGTAVVGATTMIFSIIMFLTNGLTQNLDKLSMLHPPFPPRPHRRRLGDLLVHRRQHPGGVDRRLPRGRVHQENIKLEGVEKASIEDSKKVVEICTVYAQKGMFNIFLVVFFSTLAFAFARAVLLHRLPDLHRHLRPLPGHLHGQRRRRLGQRQEDRRGRAARRRAPRSTRDRRRRHRRRSLQGHLVGGAEPGHQVHDALRPPRRRAGAATDRRPLRRRRGLLPRLAGLRLPVLLRHAHRARVERAPARSDTKSAPPPS